LPQVNRLEPIMHNVGGIDRAARILAGVAILGLYFVLDGNARWLAAVGLVPLVTGLVGWCPAYRLFGYTTSRAR
jgi:hypothetical protein